jgi:beta-phosphoglucomutase
LHRLSSDSGKMVENQSNFDAVLFDMDGVLIDAREWHFTALNEALEIFGFSISKDDHSSKYDGLTTKMKLAMLSADGVIPSVLHELISEVKQDRTLRIAAQNCYPNVSHQILLSRLQVLGVKIGLVTNSIRKSTEFMLEYAGISHYFNVIITNEDVTAGKPSPEGYLKAMSQLGVTPERVIIVEDGEYGIKAALLTGAHLVRVSSPKDVNLELLKPNFWAL